MAIKTDHEKARSVSSDHLVTIGDLEIFKADIVKELERLIKTTRLKYTKKWLKSREVEKLLNISPGKLLSMRANGILPFTRIGGTIYYDQDDIHRMFEANKNDVI